MSAAEQRRQHHLETLLMAGGWEHQSSGLKEHGGLKDREIMPSSMLVRMLRSLRWPSCFYSRSRP